MARVDTKTHTPSPTPDFSLSFASFPPKDVLKTCSIVPCTGDYSMLCLSLAVGLVTSRALVVWE